MGNSSGDSDNALLIYHCGVSVNMDYGQGSSSADDSDCVSALENYFGFKSQADYKYRIWHPFDWKSILRANLDYGWPIIYGGQDDALSQPEDAHAWVIDGYDSDDYFHCNWGWNGTANGWFSVGGFNPALNGHTCDFNEYQGAVTYIEPIRTAGIETPVLSPQTFAYNSNGYNLTIPEAEGASSYEWTTSQGTITGNGTSATLFSNCSATVHVRAYNEQCEIYSPYDSEVITVNYGYISGASIVCSSGAQFTVSSRT